MEIPALTEEVLLIIGIAAAVVVLLIILAVVLAVRRRRERARLKERFGPEYDHAVKAEGSRKAADDLSGRVEDRESFTPADPGEDTRASLRRRMAALQFRFADDPADVMLETQRVVLDALRACGYPVAEDRERALKLVSVDHPEVTQSLRSLLGGTYGRDVGRMQTLFVDAKRALRDIARVGYGPDDLAATAGTPSAPTAGAATTGAPSADAPAAGTRPGAQPGSAEEPARTEGPRSREEPARTETPPPPTSSSTVPRPPARVSDDG